MSKVKEPKTKGVARTPIVMQLETLECGAASLCMVMAYYGKWVPLEQVRIDCGVSRDGSNAMNILRAAKLYGFASKGYVRKIPNLRSKTKFPCIIHWNMAHFVVLNGFKGNKAIITDPAKGTLKVPMSVFEKNYSNICLEIIPTEDFVPSGKRKSMISFAKKRLVGAGALLLFFTLTTVIFYILGIVNPAVQQAFIDDFLGGKNQEFLLPFILIVSVLAALEIISKTIESISSYKIRGKLAIMGGSSYMWKVLRLPIEFFSQRMSGDILQRKNENASIAETLVNVFAPLLFNFVMLVFYLAVMLTKSLGLTILGVTAVLINAVFTRYVSKVKVNISRVQARDYARLVGMTSKGIEMIETIKSSGAESNYFYSWNEAMEASAEQKLKLARYSQLFNLLPSFVTLAINYGVLILGVFYSIQGSFTLGSIVAFQGFLSGFMAPALLMINSGETLQSMRTQMERVEDVMQYPVDPNIEREIIEEDYDGLNGDIELTDISFGYSKLDEPVIANFSISIKKGDTVAIVGGTGSGKSTLSKLIAGLYSPWTGKILYDGKTIEEIDHEVFVSGIAVVDQDITLFEDTIMNNIKMWDDTITDEEAIASAKDAQIHEAILKKNGGYHASLIEGGKNLSGGERQRIEIARALAGNPSIIILDEATSALDAKTEYEVVEAIKKRNVTTIVVAHRLSTIRDADKIVVLDQGKVIEEGTHTELMAKKGYYYDLIRND